MCVFQVPGPEDDMNTGAPKLLRLIGRYVGYHPAVIEQVRHPHVIQPHCKPPKRR